MNEVKVLYVPSAHYIKGAAAAVTFSTREYFKEDTKPIPISDKSKDYRGVVPWGSDNKLPIDIVEIVEKNPIASPSIEHKIDVAYGSGVKYGKLDEKGEFVEATEEEKIAAYKEVNVFFDDNDISGLYAELISDLTWFYNGFVELITDINKPDQRKIVEISAKEAMYSRLESANPKTGMVENHFYSAVWPNKPKEDEFTATPVLWSKNPTRELKKRIGRLEGDNNKKKDEKKYRYILPIKLPYPGRNYYPRPYWYSIIESGWLEFANKIPEFKKAFMLNSISIAYHIEIHEDYFKNIFTKEAITTEKLQEARVKKEYKAIEDFLKGTENAGKTLITYYKMRHEQKIEIPEIKIHVIDKKIGGEYIEDSHEASSMIAYAMRVHPSMIGVIPGKTSSNLSGSDKRELLRISQSLQKRLRDKLLSPLYLVKAINKWPEELKFSIPDILLTTIDTGNEVEKINV